MSRNRNFNWIPGDGDTVSTSELLDLIQADVHEDEKKSNANNTNGHNNNGGPTARRAAGVGSSGRHVNNNARFRQQPHDNATVSVLSMSTANDPFSVRLTPQGQKSSRRRGRGGALPPTSSSRTSSMDSLLSSTDGSGDSDEEENSSGEEDDSVGDMRDFDSYKYDSRARMTHRNNHHGTGGARSSSNGRHSSARTATSGTSGGRSSAGTSAGTSTGTGKSLKHVGNRQRMPLGGGYGGMFEFHSQSEGDDKSKTSDASSVGTSVGTSSVGTQESSLSSVFSFASRIFNRSTGGSGRWGRGNNPYNIDSHSITSRGIPLFDLHSPCLVNVTRGYLRLPHRSRYCLQLFSIVGVFMLACLNYFIAMENSPLMKSKSWLSSHKGMAPHSNSNNHHIFHHKPHFTEGGGARTHQIPRLRVRDPLQFLHQDISPNELFELAMTKFRASARFGSGSSGNRGGGPFDYGWKSMPRQIFNSFASGYSDDTKTIMHKNTEAMDSRNRNNAADLATHDFGKRELHRPPPKGTVAYVLAVTTCYDESQKDKVAAHFFPHSANAPKNEAEFRDFALMLRSTIHAHSYRNPASNSQYDYKMHAIIHPMAKKCLASDKLHTLRAENGGDLDDYNDIVDRSVLLQNLGYHVTVENSPVAKSQVRGSPTLKEALQKNEQSGGEKVIDLIRLHAYTLEEYDAVIMVDYDTLLLGPVDKAVDLIVDSNVDDGINAAVNAVFSWEYLPSLANPQYRASVINLSFFLLRPSKKTFDDLVERYLTGPFAKGKGWGKMGRGSFPGWMTTQGFLTYYYDEVANWAKVEMNRCAFGNSGQDYNGDNSILITNGGNVKCGEGNENSECNECSQSTLLEVSVADLSYCRAPWVCGNDDADGGDDENNDDDATGAAAAVSTADKFSGLCPKFQNAWFSGRLQMEDVHPQLQKGSGALCIEGRYQPMMLLKPAVSYRPDFMDQ